MTGDHDANGLAGGYVKVARKAFESDVWWLERRKFSRFEAWLDCIQLAAFASYLYRTTHGVVELGRGEFVASLRYLANRWDWTVKRVRIWLATAEKKARLRAQRETTAGTVYLVVNYNFYQSSHSVAGRAKGTAKGSRRAQQGHKIKASKASKPQTSLLANPSDDASRVLARYCDLHPRRRPGKPDRKLIERALGFGYSADELIAALEGNAGDAWHRDLAKHELTYVLRDNGLIDNFRAKREAQLRVDSMAMVIDGEMSPELELLTRPIAAAR